MTVPLPLVELSGRVGAVRELVQAAGGNTSVKTGGGLIWIKASGKWLAEVGVADFVALDLECVRTAVRERKAESLGHCIRSGEGLRPSIESGMHAVMPQAVVVHVHSVDAIAWAVRRDAPAALAGLLKGLNWGWVPYCRPGEPLAAAIAELPSPVPDVLVLGNHGLVVAAESFVAVEQLLNDVTRKLAITPRPDLPNASGELRQVAAEVGYRLPADASVHWLALDVHAARMASRSLYPDNVVFLGERPAVITSIERARNEIAEFAERHGAPPAWLLLPGLGVLARGDLGRAGEAMLGCLADVLRRVEPDAELRWLSDAESRELLSWDAETYRQSFE